MKKSKAIHTGKQLAARMSAMALRYYGTLDLSRLRPYQLDKVTGWAMKWTEDTGKNADKRHGRTKGRYLKGKL